MEREEEFNRLISNINQSLDGKLVATERRLQDQFMAAGQRLHESVNKTNTKVEVLEQKVQSYYQECKNNHEKCNAEVQDQKTQISILKREVIALKSRLTTVEN